MAGTDEALRRHMEDMRYERDSLAREIVKMEEERVLVQREMQKRQVCRGCRPLRPCVLWLWGATVPPCTCVCSACWLQEELQRLSADLIENASNRDELDAIIRESEGAYRKILEGSQALLDLVKRRAPHVPEDDGGVY